MDRQELERAFQEADERLTALRDRIVEGAEKPLLQGEWRVRDALSHVAARGNSVPMVLRRLEQADTAVSGPGASPRPVRDIHEINAGQVNDRADRSVAELLDETQAGHHAALEALPGVDDATMERKMAVAFPPGELTVAEFIYRAGPGHERTHVDEIEAALKS